MKLLSTDLDGTLLRDGNVIDEKALKELKEYINEGNIFMVSTGRALSEITFLKEEYNLHYDAAAILNGSIILDKDNKVTFIKYIDNLIAKNLREYEEVKDKRMYIVTENTIYEYGNDGICKDKNGDERIKLQYIQGIVTINFAFEEDGALEEIDEFIEKVKRKYKKKINIFRNKNYVDIAPVGCSKGRAVDHIKEKFNIKEKDVYCIGDSWNDFSMIDVAHVGATFNYAEESLRDKADKIVENIEDFIKYVRER